MILVATTAPNVMNIFRETETVLSRLEDVHFARNSRFVKREIEANAILCRNARVFRRLKDKRWRSI